MGRWRVRADVRRPRRNVTRDDVCFTFTLQLRLPMGSSHVTSSGCFAPTDRTSQAQTARAAARSVRCCTRETGHANGAGMAVARYTLTRSCCGGDAEDVAGTISLQLATFISSVCVFPFTSALLGFISALAARRLI